MFAHNHYTVALLLGKIIAERKTVIEGAEDNVHLHATLMLQTDNQFIVAVTYQSLFSPHRLPGLIMTALTAITQAEPGTQRHIR